MSYKRVFKEQRRWISELVVTGGSTNARQSTLSTIIDQNLLSCWVVLSVFTDLHNLCHSEIILPFTYVQLSDCAQTLFNWILNCWPEHFILSHIGNMIIFCLFKWLQKCSCAYEWNTWMVNIRIAVFFTPQIQYRSCILKIINDAFPHRYHGTRLFADAI